MYPNNFKKITEVVNLNRKEAIIFLNLDEKVFNNYFMFADEFQCLPRDRVKRYYFYRRNLAEWKEQYEWRTIQLNFQDYQLKTIMSCFLCL
jgi:hypothetical protein